MNLLMRKNMNNYISLKFRVVKIEELNHNVHGNYDYKSKLKYKIQIKTLFGWKYKKGIIDNLNNQHKKDLEFKEYDHIREYLLNSDCYREIQLIEFPMIKVENHNYI